MDVTDHRAQQDQRWAKLTLLACPVCGVEVFTLDVPIAYVLCAGCPGSPRLERSAT
jgi:hypothetical protein